MGTQPAYTGPFAPPARCLQSREAGDPFPRRMMVARTGSLLPQMHSSSSKSILSSSSSASAKLVVYRRATLLAAVAAAAAACMNQCAPCSAWGYVFAGLLAFLSTLIPSPRAPPTPADILSIAPPRICGPGAGDGRRGKTVGDALRREMEDLISEGTEVGISVSVYHGGEEVACVVGGVFQPVDDEGEGAPPSWRAVTPETLFMSYSVVKGVAATALLTCVDAGEVSYSQPVSSVWPGFASVGKEDVTVAQAVSHQAGVPSATPIASVVEHLFGKADLLKGPNDTYSQVTLGWAYNLPEYQGHEEAWSRGLKGIEDAQPQWTPGHKASYHYISFSWLIGGIVEHATCGGPAGGGGFRRVVEERVASKLGATGEMFVGGIAPSRLGHASRLVAPPVYAPHPSPAPPPLQRLLKRLFAALECRIFVTAGNHARWRDVCLPSSNGWFTSRSVARMYAALVNGGALKEGRSRLASSDAVYQLLSRIGDAGQNVPSSKGDARLSCGYSPWVNPEIHAHDQVTLNANGMGGCVSFGEAPSGLAMCIMKNSYEPISWAGGSVTPTSERLVRAVRKALAQEAV